LIILALGRCTPHAVSALAFEAVLQPLYGAALAGREQLPAPCAGWDGRFLSRLSAGQRSAVGNLLNTLTCTERAGQVLPAFKPGGERSALLVYQHGLVAWSRGDAPGATALWRQGQDIDRRLLTQAQRLRGADLDAARRWYEAAIMSASSPQMQAETITAYTEDLRGRVSAEVFDERLAYLAAYFGADTGMGRRLQGQRALAQGSYSEALQHLTRAVALGFADAETWYLWGESARRAGDLPATERAFRAALDAPIQVTGRRPWHLDRLAALLSSQGRLNEALPFQEEAVRLNDYYFYADNLAVLYAALGQTARAQAMCAQAAVSWSAPKALRCQNP
jgi:tetratricopeptide (TPR) repeat protein